MMQAPTVTREEINATHPVNVSQHRERPQIIWAHCGEPRNIEAFTCEGGPTSYREFKKTSSLQVHEENANWWAESYEDSNAFHFYVDSGKERYYSVDAPFGYTRSWQHFTGFSFELYNKNNGVSTHIYLRRIASKWLQPDGSIFRCAEYYDGSSGYSAKDTKYMVNKSWLYDTKDMPQMDLQRDGAVFAGFLFELRCKSGGGSGITDVYIWNMRFYSAVDGMPDNTRVVLPAMQEVRTLTNPMGYGDQI